MRRILLVCGFLVIAGLLVSFLGPGLLKARAIAPPNTPIREAAWLAIQAPYHVAAPHRSLITELKVQLVPAATALAFVPCDCTEAYAACFAGCPAYMCGKCPDCWSGPCTEWRCRVTNDLTKTCVESNQSHPCSGCKTAFEPPCAT